MSETLISTLTRPVIFALHTDDFDRAAFALRYAGYSVCRSPAHPRRYIVEDSEVPMHSPAKLLGPERCDLAPPLALELITEDIIGAILALREFGFSVCATLAHPGRYVVEDAAPQSAFHSPGAA